MSVSARRRRAYDRMAGKTRGDNERVRLHKRTLRAERLQGDRRASIILAYGAYDRWTATHTTGWPLYQRERP